MDKLKFIEKYKNEEERLLVSKLFDKIMLAEKQNKIQITDFLSPIELTLLKDTLNKIGFKNFKVFGGTKDSQRNVIIIFPKKMENIFKEDKFNYNSICKCIRISGCSENYEHKIYLGGCMKLGVKREKIGDIVVFENGADILVSEDVVKFLVNNLNELTRFKKCKIEVINLEDITKKQQEYKNLKIIVSSLRLDNVVSELSKTSRSKALEILKQERVFINYKCEMKATKLVNEKDVITIRGKRKIYY